MIYTVTLRGSKADWAEYTTEQVEADSPREAVLNYPHPNDDERRVRVTDGVTEWVFVTGVERYAVLLEG